MIMCKSLAAKPTNYAKLTMQQECFQSMDSKGKERKNQNLHMNKDCNGINRTSSDSSTHVRMQTR